MTERLKGKVAVVQGDRGDTEIAPPRTAHRNHKPITSNRLQNSDMNPKPHSNKNLQVAPRITIPLPSLQRQAFS